MTIGKEEIRAYISRTLSPSRARHSRAVARWAVELARMHGADAERAERAGLMHDLAKEWGTARLASYVKRFRVPVPGLKEIIFRRRSGLLHGYVSAREAGRLGFATDRATRNAMARHTLGHPRMRLLDKILYVADFSSRDRRTEAAVHVRRLARRNLDAALLQAVSYKIQNVVQQKGFLHPVTVSMWNFLTGFRT